MQFLRTITLAYLRNFWGACQVLQQSTPSWAQIRVKSVKTKEKGLGINLQLGQG